MADVKVGLDQVNKPAPEWYRRAVNATLIFFVPTALGIVQAVPMAAATRNVFMIVIGAIAPAMKGFGMILGNGQYIDEQKTEEKII